MPDDRNHCHTDVDFIHCRFNHRRKSGSSKHLTLRVFTEVSKTSVYDSLVIKGTSRRCPFNNSSTLSHVVKYYQYSLTEPVTTEGLLCTVTPKSIFPGCNRIRMNYYSVWNFSNRWHQLHNLTPGTLAS